MTGNLIVKLGRPPPRNRRLAGRASPIGSQTVVFYKISMPPDQRLPALVTPRVLEATHFPRQISRVNVMQARVPADLRRLHQMLRTGVFGIVHSVVLVKRGNVPWNERRDACKKSGQTFEFFFRVVEPGDEQRNDFQPDSHPVQTSDGFE